MKSTLITLRVREELVSALKKQAQREYSSMSAVIRRACVEHLEKERRINAALGRPQDGQ